MTTTTNTNVTTVVKAPLSPEEKAKRLAAMEANRKALEPYTQEAFGIIAKRKGFQASTPEAFGALMSIKQFAAEVYAVARELKDAKEGKPVVKRSGTGGTPKWLAKFTLQLQKAIGFAQKHKISAENIVKAIEYAVANPVRDQRDAEVPPVAPSVPVVNSK